MPVKLLLIVSLLLVTVHSGFAQSYPSGNLVIVGGGLEPDNKSIFTQLIGLSGGPEKAVVSVIPAASGVAMQSYVYFSKELISYGVKPENIHLIPVAMADDDSTLDVNEASWSENGNDAKWAEVVNSSSCVWFSGGDQLRILKTLVKPDGSRTPVLQAVWDVFERGGVVGGTSAGAAIMSNPMIGAGSSMGALRHGVVTNYEGDEFADSSGVLLTRGLGFFRAGMVDQHFNARGRLARLIIAMMHQQPAIKTGFGIDENTALIYNGSRKTLKVAGAGGVTIVNTSGASLKFVRKLPVIRNVMLSYLDEGDVYDLVSGAVIPASGKQPLAGNEKFSSAVPMQPGIFTGRNSNFPEQLTTCLMENKAESAVKNINFTGKNTAFVMTMQKTPESRAYSVRQGGGDRKYTVTGIRMNLEPVRVKLIPVK